MSSSRPDISEQDSHDHVDQRLNLLNERTLPKSPYLLSIPSERPYRVRSHQHNTLGSWSPFSPDEENLQYMSFLSRDWGDGILLARGDWEDANGNMANGTGETDGTRSGTATPLQTGQKKKISLSAYKNKPKGSVTGEAASGKIQTTIGAKEHSEKTDSSVTDGTRQGATGRSSIIGQKRQLDPSHSSDAEHSPPSSKKACPAPPSTRQVDDKTTSKTENADDSPPLGLPPLLSPTLPPSIERELAKYEDIQQLKQDKHHRRNQTSFSSSSSSESKEQKYQKPSSGTDVRHVSNSSSLNKSSKSNSYRTERYPYKDELRGGAFQLDGSSSAKPEAPQRRDLLSSKHTGTPDPSSKPNRVNGSGSSNSFFDGLKSKTSSKISNPPKLQITKAGGERPKGPLTVKLKYGKAKRKTVQRILQMKPQPKKLPSGSMSQYDGASSRTTERDVISQDSDSRLQEKDRNRSQLDLAGKQRLQVKSIEKRPRSNDEESVEDVPLMKRQKAQDPESLSKRPRTPLQAALKSPLSQNHSLRSQVSTPGKDIKSASMRRVDSSENPALTPQGSSKSENITAPDSAERSYRDRAPSTTSSLGLSGNTKVQENEAWRAEHNKYIDMGRKLKHEADKFLPSSSEAAVVDQDSVKHGIVLAIETVLCYILAFTNDRARSTDPQTWASLIPYIDFVEKKCRQIQSLHGLFLQLGAVIRQLVQTLEIDRLGNETLLFMTAGEGGPTTPGSEAVSLENARNEFMAFKHGLVENSKRLRYLWIEGIRELPVDDIKSKFPQTWSKRSRRPVPAQKLTPRNYPEDYYLPLGPNSSPIEAVRVGHAILQEWSKDNRVDWVSQLFA